MDIKIFGKFCDDYYELIKNTEKALICIGKKANIETINDPNKILGCGCKYILALMVNGKIVLHGEAGSVDKIMSILNKCI